MQQPSNILVVISGKRTRHAALERALKFTENADTHLHLFNSIYEPLTELGEILSSEHSKEIKRQYLADRKLYLDSLAAPLLKKGIKCTVHVTWHRERHEAIESTAKALHADLVIKRIGADLSSHNPFTMPVDRHLLRYCCAPVLLVSKSSWAPVPVLAAVDSTTDDPIHVALNRRVLEIAQMIAKLNESDLHVINTYETPTISPNLELLNFDVKAMRKNAAQWHSQKLKSLISEQHFKTEQIHVVEGASELAIPKVANEIHAQIVVLGTTGRTGLAALFIGNTAERVLSKLTNEVLAVTSNDEK